MSDRDFWSQLDQKMAQHARWQERETQRLTNELWDEMFGECPEQTDELGGNRRTN